MCYLRSDYSTVTCVSDVPDVHGHDCAVTKEYETILGIAWTVIVAYAFLVPLAIWWALTRLQPEICGKAEAQELAIALRFVYNPYKQSFYRYEIVEVIRRLVLVGFMVLFHPGTLIQLFVALTFAISMLVLQLSLRPHKDEYRSNRFVALVTSLATVATLLSCVLLRTSTIVSALRESDLQEGLWTYLDYDPVLAIIGLFCAFFSTLIPIAGSVLYYLYFEYAKSRYVRCVDRSDPHGAGVLATAPPLNGKEKHVFLSYVWKTGQDQCRTIKLKLAEVFLGVQVFLDLDDLKQGRGAEDVKKAQKLLVFLSKGYCGSKNCVRELLTAVDCGIEVIVLYEIEKARGRVYKPDELKVELDELRHTLTVALKDELDKMHEDSKKRDEIVEKVINTIKYAKHGGVDPSMGTSAPLPSPPPSPPPAGTAKPVLGTDGKLERVERGWIPFFRQSPFLDVSMLEVARRVMPPPDAGYMYTIGRPKQVSLPPSHPHLYLSAHNPGAKRLLEKLSTYVRKNHKLYDGQLINFGLIPSGRLPSKVANSFAGPAPHRLERRPTAFEELAEEKRRRLSFTPFSGLQVPRASRVSVDSMARASRMSVSSGVSSSTDPSRPSDADETAIPLAKGEAPAQPTAFLLYLDAQTWSDEGRTSLAWDVATAMERKMRIVLVHEDDTDDREQPDGEDGQGNGPLHPAAFDDIMKKTPEALKDWNLYNTVAIALHSNEDCWQISAHSILEAIDSRSNIEKLYDDQLIRVGKLALLVRPFIWCYRRLGRGGREREQEQNENASLPDNWERKLEEELGARRPDDMEEAGAEEVEGAVEKAGDTQRDDRYYDGRKRVLGLFAEDHEQFLDEIDVGADMKFNPLLVTRSKEQSGANEQGAGTPRLGERQVSKGSGPQQQTAWVQLGAWKLLEDEGKQLATQDKNLQKLIEIEESLGVENPPQEPEELPGLARLMQKASRHEVNRREPAPPKRQADGGEGDQHNGASSADGGTNHVPEAGMDAAATKGNPGEAAVQPSPSLVPSKSRAVSFPAHVETGFI